MRPVRAVLHAQVTANWGLAGTTKPTPSRNADAALRMGGGVTGVAASRSCIRSHVGYTQREAAVTAPCSLSSPGGLLARARSAWAGYLTDLCQPGPAV